jgi:hypothetical protein
MVDVTALPRRSLVEGIVNAAFTSPGLLGGIPRSGTPGLDNGDARRRSLIEDNIFWSRRCPEVVLRWCRVTLSASTMTSVSGMEQRGLNGGRVMIYRRKMEELSGVGVALTAGQSWSVRRSLLKMGLRKKAATTEFVGMVVLLACHRAPS